MLAFGSKTLKQEKHKQIYFKDIRANTCTMYLEKMIIVYVQLEILSSKKSQNWILKNETFTYNYTFNT